MSRYLAAYLAVLVSFLIIDGIWLGFIARNFYVDRLGPLMLESPRLGIAAVFYLFYAAAVVVFAVVPAVTSASNGGIATALAYGALLGLTAYGTYDFTNLATLKGWPWQVSVVDFIWGGCITAVTACFGVLGWRWAAGG